MLQPDSLVLDLIFKADAPPSSDALIDALGEDVARSRKLFNPDAVDPRIEMQLSPSMPFRRRGEARLMIIDDSVAPMRKDPNEPIVPLDLRGEKERLIALVDALDCRLGRIMALGTWGEAVIVARSARDLRAIALMSWVLDPLVDVDGHKRAQPLSKQEFEQKIAAYDKRLDELDEAAILADLGPATFERRGDLLVVDVLEPDGTWDLRKSYAMEIALQALDRFSLIPGAPASAAERAAEPSSPSAPDAQPAVEPEPTGSPLTSIDHGGHVVLVFPADRWDLDVAAALGKRDWDSLLRSSDPIPGPIRDRIRREGAGFIAPLEFLSEVFVDGTPLSRPAFEAAATVHDGGVRTLRVHCPRFGPALLIASPRGRFITSEVDAGPALLDAIGVA
ncbi:MAG: hypothetical protein D6689_15460 [Deltaproteobacteria bacterium]|nr:MAG: hypothetical protein D6689_15460 [Deltaproteobacteria bacterium]